MKLYRSPCFYLVFSWFFLFSLVISPSHGGEVSGKPGIESAKKTAGSRHRLTGTVTKVDGEEGTLRVKGRRGELSFEWGREWVKLVATGDRVRVYYVKSPDKKNVVMKIKKLNNGNESAAGKRGPKGNEQGGH